MAYLREMLSRLPITRNDFALRTDSDLAHLAAVRAGFGIGFVQHGIARRDRNLVAILPKTVKCIRPPSSETLSLRSS